jgi:bifunctional DNase/RNase
MKRYRGVVLAGALIVLTASISICKEILPAFIEVDVKGVGFDSVGQTPMVILSDKDGKRALPIWIGLLEGSAIEKELKDIPSKRPMTHDLLYSILGRLQARVEKIRIVDLKENTYYATLFLRINNKAIEIDARPSDAIILALKSKAPIFVLARILEEQGIQLSERAPGERYGIRVQPLTASLASHFRFKGSQGILVSEVSPGSVSETSGIRPGDIITKINLRDIGSVQEFEQAFDTIKEGGPARVLLFRDGKTKEVSLPLKP